MKKRILMCDDDEGILDVVNLVFAEQGYDVYIRSQCKDIISIVEEVRPDAILLDLWMPDVSTAELVHTLKKHKKTSAIPISIISAHQDVQAIARQIGADTSLQKPFNISELEKMVVKLLKK